MDYNKRRSLAARLVDAAIFSIRLALIHHEADQSFEDKPQHPLNPQDVVSKENGQLAQSRATEVRDL